MRPPLSSLSLFLAVTLITFGSVASATTVSGTLGPQYGSAQSTQTSQSNVGGANDPSTQVNSSAGSQLDAAYGYISDGTLYLFFSGNLTFWLQLEGGITHWLPLDLFIDSGAGGQHQLVATNPTIDSDYDMTKMTGLTFDSGFAPDYWLSFGGNSGYPLTYLHAYFAELPAGGGGSGAYLGQTQPGPPGVLSGGTNPNGIQVTLDDSNQLGDGSGCGAASSPSVSTGIEWAIPLAAIGNPTGCVRVCAFVSSRDHSSISNQVMGPIPPGACSLTPAAATDFSGVPGDQFFSVCPGATPTRHETWGTLKTLYR